ncbi:PREDICTED: uncharacterized protein LOC109231599 [Nicotiana attenuata]|uniref:uncharacterized protein LOC109231599 n=1 Tax=Nicotiana attenuata TaxID=49451 RepID=UPI00090580C0|nr:PREDICTED: uncharacterized protein LOC109231599 [Nicotiana attenuata]
MDDHKLKSIVDESVKVATGSFAKELEDIRSLLMEVVGRKIDLSDDHGTTAPPLRHKPASVEIGRFHGENPEAWIFQEDRYFDLYKIAENQRLTIASFYLDSDALEWYRWLFRNKQLVDWEYFAAKVRTRYYQKGLEFAEGRLAKLRQTTTVYDFQARFETLANKTDDMTDSRMSRREWGLCYYCEEKYTAGHICKNPPQLLLLTNEHETDPNHQDSFVSDDFLAKELQCLELQEHSSISYHALTGGISPSTLQFTGQVNGSSVQVLVDGGSTHNFVQPRAVKHLRLPVKSIRPISIMVESGQ